MKKNSKSNIAVKGKHHKLSLCLTKIKGFPFLAQLCLLNDCLAELTQLSLILQKESAPSYILWSKLESTTKAIQEFGFLCEDGSGNNGPETASLFKAIENDTEGEYFQFHSVFVRKPSTIELTQFIDERKLFCSTLVEQLKKRFRGPARTILESCRIFDPQNWQTDEGRKETYGGYEIRTLAMSLNFNFQECSVLPAHFRNMKKGLGVSPLLRKLIMKMETLPFTTAECERG